jgi:ABC-type transport system involved in multi-copper enzyme maturation permease subunit
MIRRLLLAEWRRIVARRVVRLTVVLTLAGIVVGGIAAFASSDSLSEATYEQRVAEAKAQQEAADAAIEACLLDHGVARGDEIPNEVADECFPAEPVGEVSDPRFDRHRLKGILQGVSAVLALIGWALGASLVGAEFSSRGMTTLLTWEPRRRRVFLAKALAVLVAMAALALAALVLVTLAMVPALVLHGAPVGPFDPTVASLAGTIGRGVALATLAAGIGFAIATIGRNTAIALGAGFAYIIVFEYVVGSSIERWRRWLLLGNVIVFVSGEDGGGDVTGRSVTVAGLFLAAVAITLLVAAAGAFRTRDLA